MDPAERVRALIEPPLTAQGVEIFDIVYGGSRLVVTVDKPGGIDVEAVAGATRLISRLLDEHDPVPGGAYTLEVSSPGVERPLRTPDHFRRHVGDKVKVKTQPGVEGDRRVEGVLDAADVEGVTIGERRLAYAEIERARTVFEWGPAPKPGSQQKKAAAQ